MIKSRIVVNANVRKIVRSNSVKLKRFIIPCPCSKTCHLKRHAVKDILTHLRQLRSRYIQFTQKEGQNYIAVNLVACDTSWPRMRSPTDINTFYELSNTLKSMRNCSDKTKLHIVQSDSRPIGSRLTRDVYLFLVDIILSVCRDSDGIDYVNKLFCL